MRVLAGPVCLYTCRTAGLTTRHVTLWLCKRSTQPWTNVAELWKTLWKEPEPAISLPDSS